MSVPKYKALLIACITLFLCGCGQALSEREIVRAVFFARQQGQYSVCLLLADQNNSEDGLHYKTSSARGATAAQALHRAEAALPGRLYYGFCRPMPTGKPPASWAVCSTTKPSPRQSFRSLRWIQPPTAGLRMPLPCMRT